MKDFEDDRRELNIRWRRLIAELVVVFIGVYCAFLLEGCREQWKQDQTRSRVLAALHQEVRQSIRDLEQIQQAYRDLTDPWLAAYKKGEMPEIREFHFVFAMRNDVWEATLESGVLEVVDIEIILTLSEQNAQMDYILEEVRAFDRFVMEHVIPNVDSGETFYDREAKELRRRYRWYPGYLKSIGDAIDTGLGAVRKSERVLASATGA